MFRHPLFARISFCGEFIASHTAFPPCHQMARPSHLENRATECPVRVWTELLRLQSQVMDLVCRLDAKLSTKDMLLPHFMADFLFKLFDQKWRATGYKYHLITALLQLANLVGLLQVLVHRCGWLGQLSGMRWSRLTTMADALSARCFYLQGVRHCRPRRCPPLHGF